MTRANGDSASGAGSSRAGSTLARFVGSLLAVWLMAWLPIGLWKGDPDYVLTVVSRGTVERQLYQALLYTGLLAVFLRAWWQRAPSRPGRGRPADFAGYLWLGLTSAVVLRLLMVGLGARDWPAVPPLSTLLLALGSALVVGVVEEAVFRGFLLGRFAESLPLSRAVLCSSVLFAAVHLFRPGTLEFKMGYGLGLLLLAILLARIAWVRQSVAAAAGFHSGVILPNLVDPWPDLASSWWAGWQGEPASGALGWLLTLALWGQWEWWQRRQRA